jgi:hypothetical protein
MCWPKEMKLTTLFADQHLALDVHARWNQSAQAAIDPRGTEHSNRED